MPQHSLDQLRQVIDRNWGYRSFRPLQEPAMQAVLDGRDSVVVMPTGAGKSLCYQAPAVLRGGTTVVVSPLIALMKDQVDSLRTLGVPAIQIDSTLTPTERSVYENDLVQGAFRLLFVSPERLASDGFCGLLQRAKVHTFAIDEAHCISHWGHDFRPDYRQLGKLKEMFPGAALHAYTATATEAVRQDICQQLHMNSPVVLVGNFDRPNLTYRVIPRGDETRQVMEVLNRHKGEAGIIYCIRRNDVDELDQILKNAGFRSLPYHAGMDKEHRRAAQEAFAAEKCDVIVATVAFGMGINRSNLRFVLHAAMPKSIEHYQQETGRAGRDGLEAECVLLHGAGDMAVWQRIMSMAKDSAATDPKYLKIAFKHLDDIDRYCRGANCRHRALVQHFGQTYTPPGESAQDGEGSIGLGCAACDICLGDAELVPDSALIAQKILSCVARVQERYGVNHVVSVLRGENLEKIRSLEHDKLSTYGLLREHDATELRDWILQLISQGVLTREGDEYPILKLNPASWEVMKKQRTIKLLRRKKEEGVGKSRADTDAWEGVDRGLFEQLRHLRRELAERDGVAAHLIFSDNTLRDLAKVRPSTLEKFKQIYGVGERKLQEFGMLFLQVIQHYCRIHEVATDVRRRPVSVPKSKPVRPTSGVKAISFQLFEEGFVPEDVAHQTGRALRAILGDLAEYIRWKAPPDITRWIDKETYARVEVAARKMGTNRLKPIFDELKEAIPYEDIRLVVSHLESQHGPLDPTETEPKA